MKQGSAIHQTSTSNSVGIIPKHATAHQTYATMESDRTSVIRKIREGGTTRDSPRGESGRMMGEDIADSPEDMPDTAEHRYN